MVTDSGCRDLVRRGAGGGAVVRASGAVVIREVIETGLCLGFVIVLILGFGLSIMLGFDILDGWIAKCIRVDEQETEGSNDQTFGG